MSEYEKEIFPCVVDSDDGLQVVYEPDEVETQFMITQGGVEIGETICLGPAQTLNLINFLLRAHDDMGRPRPVYNAGSSHKPEGAGDD